MPSPNLYMHLLDGHEWGGAIANETVCINRASIASREHPGQTVRVFKLVEIATVTTEVVVRKTEGLS